MKQAINIPPIKPFIPPIPLHENHAQENFTAAVPCSSAVKATIATIRSTAYWKTTTGQAHDDGVAQADAVPLSG
jgi:hypothetical protein